LKILLVEDDIASGTVLVAALKLHHYHVDWATDGEMGLAIAQTCEPDLMVLDIGLPRLDGIALCRQLRQQGYEKPILLLTGKDSPDEQIQGLDAGADDYAIKPYDLETLLARIRALLRRGKSSAVMAWGNIQVDAGNSEVTYNNQPLRLTPKEYCLLELFLLNPKRIYSRRAILDRLWDFAESPGEDTVSTHIKGLRHKLKAAGSNDPIETVHGLGYRLRSPASQPESLPPVPPPTPNPTPNPTLSSKAQKTAKAAAAIARIWNESKGQYAEMAGELAQILQAVDANTFPADQQQRADFLAHKLAGGLGIFGLMAVSQQAKEVELLMKQSALKPEEIRRSQILSQEVCQAIDRASLAPAVSPATPSIPSPLLLIVDDDLALADRIRIEAIAWDMQVEIAIDLTIARKAIAQRPPNIILLDLTFPGAAENGLTLLQELSQRVPPIPVVVFTGRDSLQDRVDVARRGGMAFLHKPLPAHQILKTAIDVWHQSRKIHRNRVLIVDNDTAFTQTLSALLATRGIEVTHCTQPQQFWQVLTHDCPDLLVLNWIVPEFSGVELCRVVRTAPEWQNLPVLFCANCMEPDAIAQAYAAGGDDFMSKSLSSDELVTRILQRLL
jgi:DNA-binding response OmpR family regulator/HPt (histidine-containing phosphotransfer) domain-containing protein